MADPVALRVAARHQTAAVKLKKLPSSRSAPMWETEDGRFLIQGEIDIAGAKKYEG